jgi:hypothetical protein
MKGVTQLQGEGAGEQSDSGGARQDQIQSHNQGHGQSERATWYDYRVVDVCCLYSNTSLRLAAISTHHYRCLYTIGIIANLTIVAMHYAQLHKT